VTWDAMAVVGRIARRNGNRGEVIVNSRPTFPQDRFRAGAEMFIERRGAVEAVRLVKVRFQHERPVVAIDGVATMNDAEALAVSSCACPSRRSRRCRRACSTGNS